MAKAAKLKTAPEPAPLLKLDLACGQRCQAGYEGVDIVKLEGVKWVHDLRQTPWPWADASVEEVVCSHFLEHLTGLERMAFMEELYRILIIGGKAQIATPYWSSMRSVQDPTHQWPPLCEASYLYFNAGWRKQNGLDHYAIKCDFDFTYGYGIAPAWQQRSDELRNFAVANYVNAAADLHVTLIKREPAPPG